MKSFTSILCYFVAVLAVAGCTGFMCSNRVLLGIWFNVVFMCWRRNDHLEKNFYFAAICIFGVIMVIQPWQGNKMAEHKEMVNECTCGLIPTENSQSDSSGSHITEATHHVTITRKSA